jgi:hypothetical protein
MFLAAVYTSPQRPWSDKYITKLLGFRNMSILADDLNGKHPVWNSEISNPSGLKLLELFVSSNFEISAPQCSMHYTPDGRDDVLNSAVHQNIQLPELIITDILDSNHLPIMFSILDLYKKEAFDPVEKLTD